MADNYNKEDLKEVLFLTKSIGKEMDKLAASSDKRNKNVASETSLVKSLVGSIQNQADLENSIAKIHQRKQALGKNNLGVNQKMSGEINKQLKYAQGALQTELRRQQITEKVSEISASVADGLSDSIDTLKSSVEEVPILGKALSSMIPAKSLKKTINAASAGFTRGFGVMFKRGLTSGKGFMKSFTGGISAGFAQISKVMKTSILANPIILATAAIVAFAAAGVMGFSKIEGAAKAFRQETGLLNSQTQGLQDQIAQVVTRGAKLGIGFDDASKAASTFASEFNNVDRASANTAFSLAMMEKNFGVSVAEGAKLNKLFTNLGGVSTDTAQALSEQVVSLAKQNNVAPSKVIEDINANAEEIGRMFRGNTKALTEQAIQAAKLGTSLGEALKVSKGLLDYDSSINDELEASAILNTNLNFSNARALAASGNYLDAQREIVKQTQKTVDLNNLNMYEAEALEKATGMTVVQMQNLARVEEMKNKLGEDGVKALGQAIKSGEDLSKLSQEELIAKSEALAEQQEMQSSIDKMQNSFKAVGMELMAAFAPIGEAIIPMFQTLAEILAPIGSLFSWISEYTSGLGEKVSAMIGPLGVVGKILKGIASIAIIFAAYKAFASLASIPFVGAALGAIAAGAVLAAGFGFLSSIQVGDVMSPADGKTQISTKEGGLLELSSNDDVMAAPGLFDRMKSRREQRAFSRAEMNLAPLLQKMDTLIAATKGKQVLVADGRQLASTTATQQEVSLKNQFGLNSAIST